MFWWLVFILYNDTECSVYTSFKLSSQYLRYFNEPVKIQVMNMRKPLKSVIIACIVRKYNLKITRDYYNDF